jgi:hypothetical protein
VAEPPPVFDDQLGESASLSVARVAHELCF